MGTGQIYLGGWASIGRYHCRWWICSKHGKNAKSTECVRVIGNVYLVHDFDSGLVAIKKTYAECKKAFPIPNRDSPLCPFCEP